MVGVPVRLPVAALNVAQLGLLTIANVSVWPSGSDPVGWNEYAFPAVTLVAGVPLIDGGELAARTVMLNAGSEALTCPSETVMTMLLA